MGRIFFDRRAVHFTFPSSSAALTCPWVARGGSYLGRGANFFGLGRERADCFCQWRCNSTISERFLAPPSFGLVEAGYIRWAISMILRLNATAPWPAASEVLSNGHNRCVESIHGPLVGFVALIYGLLGHGSHALRYRGVETELGRRGAIILARLFGGLELGGIHHRASWVIAGDFAGWPPPATHRKGAWPADSSGKGVRNVPSAPKVGVQE